MALSRKLENDLGKGALSPETIAKYFNKGFFCQSFKASQENEQIRDRRATT